METALGLVCDALPMVGERAMVFGQGVVGLLTVGVLGRYPLAELVSADPVAERRDFSRQFGAHLAVDPSDPRELAVLEDCLFHGGLNGLDIAIEVSGQTEALNRAIDLTGYDGRIVIGSWYGATGARVDLGERFHRRRLRLISSQVSSLSPVLSGRWSKFRRLELAVEWLNRLAPERLVTHRFPLSACQQAFEAVANYATGATQVLIEYP
jgi:threonine dehydrogenase-like Zn-dependent dehydrogenase